MKRLARPSATFVDFSNGTYVAVVAPPRTSSFLVVLVREKQMAAKAMVIPWRQGVHDVLREVLEVYGVDIKLGKNVRLLRDAAGTWQSNKSLHPLIDKAVKESWSWYKDNSAAFGESIEFGVKLPKGMIRQSKGVTYEGYTNRLLKAHSFEALNKVTQDAIALCASTWGWSPVDLRMMTHNAGKAMGIAYAPGKGVNKVSLHSKLLNEYDTMSIFRVILHELCHHYREEKFPSNPYDVHDSIFCRELKRVDTVLKDDGRDCKFFTDEQWEGSKVVQSQIAKKKAEVYDNEQGYFKLRIIKSGEFRLDWVARPDGGKFQKKAIPVSIKSLSDIAKAGDVYSLELWAGDKKGERYINHMSPGKRHTTMATFIQHLDKNYPSRGYGALL